jgi:hypothetical protein
VEPARESWRSSRAAAVSSRMPCASLLARWKGVALVPATILKWCRRFAGAVRLITLGRLKRQRASLRWCFPDRGQEEYTGKVTRWRVQRSGTFTASARKACPFLGYRSIRTIPMESAVDESLQLLRHQSSTR